MRIKKLLEAAHSWGVAYELYVLSTPQIRKALKEIRQLLEILEEDDCVSCWKGIKHEHK